MTKEELAAILHGREHRSELTKDEAKNAADMGLVVVFGYSDDLMEFCGAIDEEVDCYDGGTAYLKNGRMLKNKCEDEDCPYFAGLLKTAMTVESIWDAEGYSWTYKTDIPHATFDILEDGKKYCRGIVFAVEDVKEAATCREK